MISYEKFKKNIVKNISEIKSNSGLDTSKIRILCPICDGKFWSNKKYKHLISQQHQQKLNEYIIKDNYDKNINRDVFIVYFDFY